MRRATLLFLLIVVGWSWGASALAQPPALRFDHLTVEDGFTDAVIMAVARDAAGFLWVGTQGGLNRYDGARVRPFRPGGGPDGGLPDGYVLAVAEDPRTAGAVWIGTNTPGLTRYDPRTDRLEAPPTDAAGAALLAAAPARVLHPDGRGALWVGTDDAGLLRYDPATGAVTAYRRADGGARAIAGDSVRALYAPPSAPGTVWVGTTHGLSRLDTRRGAVTTFRGRRSAPRALSTDAVLALAEAGGHLWVGTADGVLHRYDPATEGFERFDVTPTGAGAVSALAPSRRHDGVLWVGTRGDGLLAFDTRTGTATPVRDAAGENGLSPRADVLTLEEDAAGLLWVGTVGGLYRADGRSPRFTPIRRDPRAASTLSAPSVLSLYVAPSEPDVVWIGTLRGGLNRLDRTTGRYTHYFTDGGHPLSLTFAMREDRSGGFWLGAAAPSLFLLDRATGAAEAYALPPSVQVVYAIYEAPSRPGTLWVATQGGGLVAFDVARRAVVGQLAASGAAAGGGAPALTSDDVWSVLETPDEPGALWVATQGGGLHRLDLRTGAVEAVEGADGCRLSERIVSLAAGRDGTLWLGTFDEGLIRFDRHTRTCWRYAREDGRAQNDVGAIFLDARERLWMSTGDGLVLFDPRREAFTRFTEADGLQGRTFYYPARHRTPAGEFLFGGEDGFHIIDPLRVPVDTAGPPVVITRLLVDGQPYPLVREGDGFRPVTLRHGQNDVAVEFAALDLRAPARNRYRVRRAGAGGAWQGLGARAEVRYPYLPAGRYALHVAGTNADGYWGAPGVLAFVIRPPLWRTWYFWTLTAALAVGLIVGGYQYRIRQLLRLEQTRRRIADDLHDDIGSKVSTVALRLDLAGRRPALPDEERRHLAELAEAARAVVDDLRDAVWIVDAGHDDLPALAARMEQFAGQMLDGRPHTFERPEVLPPVPLSMEARRHVYLLFKEALHNAARHGRPSRVDVRLAYADGRLTLTVADDGTGFAPDAATGGRGLSTMRARAEALGGRLRIESAPGRGTVVTLDAPLAGGRGAIP